MHSVILLLLHPLEALQIYNQYWGCPENLNLLNSLLMHFASAAEPSVLVRELLGRHELSEAVVYGHLVIMKESLSLIGFLGVHLAEEL